MTKTIIKINPLHENLREDIERLLKETIAAKTGSSGKQSDGVASGKRGCDKSLHGNNGLPEGAEYIYQGRNNLFRAKVGDKNVIVKDFKKPNIINRYVYTTLRKSKAARSYLNALKMQELGFKTPEPIAYCEVRHGLELAYSFYISEELAGATEMRDWQSNPDCDTLLPAFAGEIKRLHDAGVWHKDFSPGNILYVRDEKGDYSFYYVDLNRMKFGVHDRERQMRMFRAINLDRSETERLGRLYGQVAGLDPEETGRKAVEELEGYFTEQAKKKKAKSILGK